MVNLVHESLDGEATPYLTSLDVCLINRVTDLLQGTFQQELLVLFQYALRVSSRVMFLCLSLINVTPAEVKVLSRHLFR